MTAVAAKRLPGKLIGPGEHLLTYPQVAERLQLSTRTVRREVDAGRLEAVRLGPSGMAVRITARSVERYAAVRLVRTA